MFLISFSLFSALEKMPERLFSVHKEKCLPGIAVYSFFLLVSFPSSVFFPQIGLLFPACAESVK